MSLQTTKELMTELKLHGMKLRLDSALIEMRENQLQASDVLDTLLQAEYDCREQRKREQRIKNSKLKTAPSFEEYDFSVKRTLTKSQLKEIYELDWLKEGRPLVLIGQTGVGKTFLAHATGLRACSNKKTVLFLSFSLFLETAMLHRATGHYLKFREKTIKPDLLILDDFGMKKLTSGEAEDLREILEERSFGKSTMITTQLPIDHWAEAIPDQVLADSIKDRFAGPGLVIDILGDSYRKYCVKNVVKKGVKA